MMDLLYRLLCKLYRSLYIINGNYFFITFRRYLNGAILISQHYVGADNYELQDCQFRDELLTI